MKNKGFGCVKWLYEPLSVKGQVDKLGRADGYTTFKSSHNYDCTKYLHVLYVVYMYSACIPPVA